MKKREGVGEENSREIGCAKAMRHAIVKDQEAEKAAGRQKSERSSIRVRVEREPGPGCRTLVISLEWYKKAFAMQPA